MESSAVAPAHLVVGGRYSDVRFIDMTVAHHLMAIRMAQVEIRLGTRSALREMAREMIAEQRMEIADLKTIRQRLAGSAATPTTINPHVMAQTGVPMPDQLARTRPTDLAFIDAMVPHHSSLILLANVALRQSGDQELIRIARSMIDSQANQVDRMIAMRQRWYPGTPQPPAP